ncbi:hypothetical protein SNE40_018190 [Patella caerulea]|uniref:Uncharacterized protein n=1 Tax=Patella caerulea TaxID=87958 RepID=A0AAN8J7X2_PATCE
MYSRQQDQIGRFDSCGSPTESVCASVEPDYSIDAAVKLDDVPATIVPLIETNINITSQPKTSQVYPEYWYGTFSGTEEDKDDNQPKPGPKANCKDIAWLMSRYFGRKSIDDPDVQQAIGPWSVYNSACCSNRKPQKDNTYILTMINGTPTEIDTIVTAIDQLIKLNEEISPGKCFIISMDMDLYKRALKVGYLDPKYAFDLYYYPRSVSFSVVWS